MLIVLMIRQNVVQLELAPNLITECKNYVQNKFRVKNAKFFDSEAIVGHVYDFSVLSAVYNYYFQNSNKIFIDYFKEFLYKDFEHISVSPIIKKSFDNFYKPKIEFWEALLSPKSKWGFVGDPHNQSVKIKYRNNIYYNKVLDYELFINSVLKVIPTFENLFPKTVVKNDICIRKYKKFYDGDVDEHAYYYNFGKLLAFAVFFRSIDLNFENFMIIDKATPYVFDLEFLFAAFEDYTTEYTGLISKVVEDNTSAILGGLNRKVYSYLKPVVFGDVNGKNPTIKWKVPSKRKLINIPKGSQKHPFEYIDEITSGMKYAFKELLNHKHVLFELVSSINIITRFIVRPTRVYRYAYLEYAYPQVYLEKGFREVLREQLESIDIISNINVSYDVKKIVHYEVDTLELLSIPFYYTNIKERYIYSDKGDIVGFLERTPYDIWVDWINRLGNGGYEAEIGVVRMLLKGNYNTSAN